MISDALLRELVILEQRLHESQDALKTIGRLLKLDVRSGSVSAMKASLRENSANNKGRGAQPPLPF